MTIKSCSTLSLQSHPNRQELVPCTCYVSSQESMCERFVGVGVVALTHHEASCERGSPLLVAALSGVLCAILTSYITLLTYDLKHVRSCTHDCVRHRRAHSPTGLQTMNNGATLVRAAQCPKSGVYHLPAISSNQYLRGVLHSTIAA